MDGDDPAVIGHVASFFGGVRLWKLRTLRVVGEGGGGYAAVRATCLSRRWNVPQPRGLLARSATSAASRGRVTMADLRPSRSARRYGSLRTECGAGGHAPLGERQPIEQTLGEQRPRRRWGRPASHRTRPAAVRSGTTTIPRTARSLR